MRGDAREQARLVEGPDLQRDPPVRRGLVLRRLGLLASSRSSPRRGSPSGRTGTFATSASRAPASRNAGQGRGRSHRGRLLARNLNGTASVLRTVKPPSKTWPRSRGSVRSREAAGLCKPVRGDPQRPFQPGPRRARPGFAPVCSPRSSTSVPLTRTVSTPDGITGAGGRRSRGR